MRVFWVFLLSFTWMSCAEAANYPVGSADEVEALKYEPDSLDFFFLEIIKRLEEERPHMYEIRIQDVDPNFWYEPEQKEAPP